MQAVVIYAEVMGNLVDHGDRYFVDDFLRGVVQMSRMGWRKMVILSAGIRLPTTSRARSGGRLRKVPGGQSPDLPRAGGCSRPQEDRHVVHGASGLGRNQLQARH